jgi:hypothetical protein
LSFLPDASKKVHQQNWKKDHTPGSLELRFNLEISEKTGNAGTKRDSGNLNLNITRPSSRDSSLNSSSLPVLEAAVFLEASLFQL